MHIPPDHSNSSNSPRAGWEIATVKEQASKVARNAPYHSRLRERHAHALILHEGIVTVRKDVRSRHRNDVKIGVVRSRKRVPGTGT